MEEQKSGSAFESSKTLDIHIGYPSLKRILVAYDGMEMSKRALGYAAYFSKKSDSEIVLVNVVKANADLNKVLPLTIKANLEGKEEQQLPMAGSQRQVLLNEDLRGVVEEMTTACGAATLAKKIIYDTHRESCK
jgi:hypothetical protein